MTEEQKQALIDYCKEVQGNNPETSVAYQVISIALAALTAEPEYNTSHGEDVHLDVKKAAYDRCHPDYRWISYPAPPVPVMKPVKLRHRIANIDLRSPLEVEDIYRDSFKAAIRAAGYQVEVE